MSGATTGVVSGNTDGDDDDDTPTPERENYYLWLGTRFEDGARPCLALEDQASPHGNPTDSEPAAERRIPTLGLRPLASPLSQATFPLVVELPARTVAASRDLGHDIA